MSHNDYRRALEDLYTRAVEIATAAHEGQTRWGGEPYITHPLAVANYFHMSIEKIVAVLHDVIEDTDITGNDLLDEFPDEIVGSVLVMTHKEHESYADYIMRVRKNHIARKVKLADIKHNLSDLDKNPQAHKQRKDKYQLAIKLLEI